MKKTILLIAMFSFLFSKESVKTKNEITKNYRGYKKLEVYFYKQGKKKWEKSNAYTFQIPKDGSKLIPLFGGIGIDRGNKIEYYSLSMNNKGWKRNINYDFYKKKSDKIIPVFGGIGIKKGNVIEYYSLTMNNKGWKRKSSYDIRLPSSYTKYVTMFGGYAIKNNNRLEYYSHQQKNRGWKRKPKYDITIKNGQKFLSLHEHIFFGGFGIYKKHRLEFYSLNKDGWKRKISMDFNTANTTNKQIISVPGGIGILN